MSALVKKKNSEGRVHGKHAKLGTVKPSQKVDPAFTNYSAQKKEITRKKQRPADKKISSSGCKQSNRKK